MYHGTDKSLKSKPSFHDYPCTDSRNLSVPSNVRLFVNARPPYRQHCERTDAKDTASSRNQSKVKGSPVKRRRSSLSGNVPLAERIQKYQEALKQSGTYVQRSKYEGKIPIRERISKMEGKLGGKGCNKPRNCNDGQALRLASPERAAELVKRYFDNPNPKSKRWNQQQR